MGDLMDIDIERVGDQVITTFTSGCREVKIVLEAGDAANYGAQLASVAMLGGSVVNDATLSEEFPSETLPCCGVIEHDEGSTPEHPMGAHRCPGTMLRGVHEYVCDTCRGRCGVGVHPRCDTGVEV